MTSDAEDSVLLIVAEAVVSLAEAQRAATIAMTGLVRELREAMEAMPAPVVNVPAPEVRVAAPVINVPAVQDVRIVGLPPMNARVKRDRAGRIEAVTEG